MLLPSSLVATAVLAQSLVLGQPVTFPVDAGDPVTPSSTDALALGSGFLVVWADDRRARFAATPGESGLPVQDIWAATLAPSMTGTVSPAGSLVCASPRGERFSEPRVAGDGGEALVVWRSQRSDGGVSLRGARVQGDGGLAGHCGHLLADALGPAARNHRVAWGPAGYFLTWEEPFTLKGRPVDPETLVPLVAPVVVASTALPAGSGQDRLPLSDSALVGTGEGFLAAWLEGAPAPMSPATVRTMCIAAGQPAPAPDAGLVGVQASALTLVPLGDGGLATLFVNPIGKLEARLVDPSTGQLNATGTTPLPALGPLLGLALSGGELLTVWRDPVDTVSFSSSEVTLGSQSASMPSSLAPLRPFALARNDVTEVVVGLNALGHLEARWRANGQWSPTPTVFGSAPASQRGPDVAWDGAAWVVTWAQRRLSLPDAAAVQAAAITPGNPRPVRSRVDSDRLWGGLLSRPTSHELRALTVAPALGNASVTTLQPGDGGFVVTPPMLSQLVLGDYVGASSGDFIDLVWSESVLGPDEVRVMPSRAESLVEGAAGRCAAVAAGKVWFASVKVGGEVVLWGVPDEVGATLAGSVKRTVTFSGARGRPCVAAKAQRLLVAIETNRGVETVEYDLDADQAGPGAVLTSTLGTLSRPVVAPATGGWVVVSEARIAAGPQTGLRQLVAHAVGDDGAARQAPKLVSDQLAPEAGRARLAAHEGDVFVAWEYFDGREGVAARAITFIAAPADGGVADGGGSDPDAGSPEDAGVGEPPPVLLTSCGCAADGGLLLGLGVAALALTRRRRRVRPTCARAACT